MCLDTVNDMNETLKTVQGDNSDADIDLGCEENFHSGLNDYDNERLYIHTVPALSEESAIPMIADKKAVNDIPKIYPPCGKSHVCAHGAAAHT